ncbi:MAG: sialate O-acetylesterase [Opitutales bacterium]|nr:sialate O-acetylesterase [Opitutales bacterium]
MEVRSGSDTIRFRDVLVGDVWLCSGQSNMACMLRTVADGDIEMAGSDMTRLRLFQVGRRTAENPRFSSGDKWSLCDSASSAQFSAIAYFFGKKLHQTLNIPIGLIESSWSGTPIVAWTGEGSLLAHVHTKALVQTWDASIKRRNYDPKVALNKDRPGILASSMLTPVCPFTLKGFIWYQGEDDIVWEPDLYDLRLGIMLDDWKQRWGQSELPFGMVQLANFGEVATEPVDSDWARIRDCQLRFSLKTPGVGLIVAIDQGETDNIHPARKQVLGNRLARWALTDVYRKINLAGGPIIREFEVGDGAIEVAFDNAGQGLIALHGDPLREFSIAGDDRIFHRANAAIVSPDRVRVSSDAVAEPVAVRYAWADNPIHANLCNDQRLPASPFRTDSWEKTPPKDKD